jgi:DNA-binding MarR family transcriptional regulator
MDEDKPGTQTSRSAAPSADDYLPDHLPRWLEAVSRRLSAEIGKHIGGPSPELRGSHRRILQMIPPNGARITDLARVANMTKQSLGELIDGLEQSGLVASRQSPTDGRVRIVSRTQAGDDVAAASQKVIAAVERQWRSELGAARFDAMKAALRELGRDVLRY